MDFQVYFRGAITAETLYWRDFIKFWRAKLAFLLSKLVILGVALMAGLNWLSAFWA